MRRGRTRPTTTTGRAHDGSAARADAQAAAAAAVAVASPFRAAWAARASSCGQRPCSKTSDTDTALAVCTAQCNVHRDVCPARCRVRQGEMKIARAAVRTEKAQGHQRTGKSEAIQHHNAKEHGEERRTERAGRRRRCRWWTVGGVEEEKCVDDTETPGL